MVRWKVKQFMTNLVERDYGSLPDKKCIVALKFHAVHRQYLVFFMLLVPAFKLCSEISLQISDTSLLKCHKNHCPMSAFQKSLFSLKTPPSLNCARNDKIVEEN